MAPLRSRRPSRSSSTSARWKPPMGTQATGSPCVRSVSARSAASVDLPAPGDPVMPSSTRPWAPANALILATRRSWSAASTSGSRDAGQLAPSGTPPTPTSFPARTRRGQDAGSVGVIRPDGEDGARGAQQDALGVAAQQRLADGGAAVDAHDEQLGADLPRPAHDGAGGGGAPADVQVPDPVRHALAVQPCPQGVEVQFIGGSGTGVA